MPKVSICIPTFNGAEFLAQCIHVAQSQTFNDFEIIVVDDQSNDETWRMVSDRAAAFPNIRAFRNERNLGLVGNWNRCIELARGDWIKFLFQDDLIEPDCVSRMVNAGERTGYPLVACRRDFLFDAVSANIVEEFKQYTNRISMDAATGDKTDLSPEDVSRAALRFGAANFIGEPSSTLIRRDVFEKLGSFSPEIIQLCDLEYWLRVGVNFGMAYVPETLAHFRVHGQSTTSKNTATKEYLKDVVDPLILAREFALSAHYENLRQVARAEGVDLVQTYYRSLTDELCKARSRMEGRVGDGPEAHAQLAALEALQQGAALPPAARAALGLKMAGSRTRRAYERHLAWRFSARS